MNENCLEGICCPKCGSIGPFRIACTAVCYLTDDGPTEDFTHVDYDENSMIRCEDCDCQKTMGEFTEQERNFRFDTGSVVSFSGSLKAISKKQALEFIRDSLPGRIRVHAKINADTFEYLNVYLNPHALEIEDLEDVGPVR